MDTELYGVERGGEVELAQLNMLRREVVLLSSLHHPNVLQLIGVLTNEAGHIDYLVTELAHNSFKVRARVFGA